MDREGYLGVHSRIASTFDIEARLPDEVFREAAGGALFCEFDIVLSPMFWPALRAMASWHGDRHVYLLVCEPECEDFYLPEYRMYPAMSLSVDASDDDYWSVVGYEPSGDVMGSIAISAQVIAVTGASGRWGCWGERDPEVAVFRGFPDDAVKLDEWRTRFGPFLDAGGASASYLPLTFAGRTVPERYAATLMGNYGSLGH